MALAGKSSGKNLGTVTRAKASINSEPFWIPSVTHLETLGACFGIKLSIYAIPVEIAVFPC